MSSSAQIGRALLARVTAERLTEVLHARDSAGNHIPPLSSGAFMHS